MSTILFLSGMGVGALVSILLLVAVFSVSRRISSEGREASNRTENILREGNLLRLRRAKALERIGDLMETYLIRSGFENRP